MILFWNNRYIWWLNVVVIIAILFLSSCEKEVDITLKNGQSKIVVDGQIENDGYPIVILTKSIGYFSTIDLSVLEKSFIHGAIIKVSDGVDTIILREYSLDTGINNLNKFYLYTIDTTQAGAFNFKGKFEHEYHLSIDYDGKHYESETKIPNVRGIDSIWFRKLDGNPKITTGVRMFVKFTDPDSLGNYLRYFTRRNNELFYPGINSVYEDDIVNGTTIDSLNLPAGYNRAKEPNLDSLGLFFLGDTVSLRWTAIDRNAFEFFRTFEYATGTVGNPFASPVNVLSNIRGGALGVWVGYGCQYTTRILQK